MSRGTPRAARLPAVRLLGGARRSRGFAVLAVTVLLAAVATLAWTVTAPTALQVRMAGTWACRASARLAADAALRRARAEIEEQGLDEAADARGADFFREAESPPRCRAEGSCYRIRRVGARFRVDAAGWACGEGPVWLEMGGVVGACVEPGREEEVAIRWRRQRALDRRQGE